MDHFCDCLLLAPLKSNSSTIAGKGLTVALRSFNLDFLKLKKRGKSGFALTSLSSRSVDHRSIPHLHLTPHLFNTPFVGYYELDESSPFLNLPCMQVATKLLLTFEHLFPPTSSLIPGIGYGP